jgi:hypothetical protein
MTPNYPQLLLRQLKEYKRFVYFSYETISKNCAYLIAGLIVADTVSELPVTRQAEVYHFVQLMKKEKK